MHDRKVARGEPLSLRIGIHVGDVVESGSDILGDAVNIASRIEPLAEPGGVCITSQAYEQVRNKSDLQFVSLGEKSLKNVATPVSVYAARMPWEQTISTQPATYPTNRIAILPFASFSLDPNDAFFADGITDEIISAVAGISGLNVISRTSVVGYKGTTKKVKEIGKELEVGSILEGTFKKAGNKIRVTTQLIDVAGDRHLWAQNYDRTLDDVFEVQSDVAKQVAEALRVRVLSPERERIEKKPTESTVAYTLYLKGRSLWNERRLEGLKKAMEYFELAVREDPSFALGYVGQADCALYLRGHFLIDPERNLSKAKEMAERALNLDPALAEAHATLGGVYQAEYDDRRAEEEFRRAIELKPSYATARYWYSQLAARLWKWDEALKQSEKAEELDPLSPMTTLVHSHCLLALGRKEESLRVLESAERLNPDGHIILARRAIFLCILGRLDEAGECLERASKVDADYTGYLDIRGHYEQLVGNYAKAVGIWERAKKIIETEGGDLRGFYADMASAYWDSGDKDKALDCVREIEAMPVSKTADERSVKQFWLACAYAATGDSKRFFSAVAQMAEEKRLDFSWLREVTVIYPASKDFVDDPRWNALFKNAGLEP